MRRGSKLRKNKKYSLEYIRDKFSEVGFTVLSGSYENAHCSIAYKCSKGHIHTMSWNKFQQGRRCPYCSHRLFCKENSLSVNVPKLADEWDYIKNGNLRPENVFCGSSKKVWWKCKECSCEWKATVNNRTNKVQQRGCPGCNHTVVTGKNSLKALFPNVAKEWHPSKNKELKPSDIVSGSNKKVWWVCSKCGHIWKAIVNSRTRPKASGCAACVNQVATDHNNLAVLCPALSLEWCWSLNGGAKPESFVAGSNKKVWWECNTCGHCWKSNISNRTRLNSGCPLCAKGPVSKLSQEWLDMLKVEAKYREYSLYVEKRLLRVDGFDPKTNTVYEFFGDYWHGNLAVYSAKKLNPNSKKLFGTLNKETMDRINLLKGAGYNVIYIWENEFKNKDLSNA